MNFLHSIKFRLTAWYTLTLLIVGLALIGLFNIYAANYYKRDVIDTFPMHLRQKIDSFSEFPNGKPPVGMQQIRDILQEVRNEDLARLQQVSIITVIFVVIGASICGYVVADRMLDPIRKVNKAAQKINADNLYSSINQTGSKDEIGELIKNFNNMTDRLRKSFNSQKQFTENAAHELKTPITILYANIENQLIDTHITNEHKDWLEKQLESLKRMSTLVDQLLLLSSLSHISLQKETTKIAKLITSSVSLLDDIAAQKNIVLNFESNDFEIEIDVYADLLIQAISNILDNAIKYSPVNTQVNISLTKFDSTAVIKISDHGTGIQTEHKLKIFDRFFRVDNSRSRATGGFGLGLAITKEIVELHNGKIIVEDNQGDGSIFNITIPISKSK